MRCSTSIQRLVGWRVSRFVVIQNTGKRSGAAALSIISPWIEHKVEQVRSQVHQREQNRQHEDRPL